RSSVEAWAFRPANKFQESRSTVEARAFRPANKFQNRVPAWKRGPSGPRISFKIAFHRGSAGLQAGEYVSKIAFSVEAQAFRPANRFQNRVPPWKRGPSGPRIGFKNNVGFSP